MSSSRQSGGSGDRSRPRDYRDLDRDRMYDDNRQRHDRIGGGGESRRRSISPARRGHYEDRSFDSRRRYENHADSRNSGRYDRHQDNRYHPPQSSRRREYSPPTRQARRDLEEERQRRKAEEDAAIASASATAAEKEKEKNQSNDIEGEEDEEAAMMKAMGFEGFGSTKGKKVEGNQKGSAEVRKERTWRQYMQRKGGFNRPLSPVRK